MNGGMIWINEQMNSVMVERIDQYNTIFVGMSPPPSCVDASWLKDYSRLEATDASDVPSNNMFWATESTSKLCKV